MSYKEEFKKSYEEGRIDTRNEIQKLRAGEMTHDFSRTLVKPVVYISLLLTIAASFYGWFRFGFLLAILIAVGTWFASFFILGLIMLLIVAILKVGTKPY